VAVHAREEVLKPDDRLARDQLKLSELSATMTTSNGTGD